jgi:large conductance mechanosensitive channel
MSFASEFKEFAMKGNVIDLAVGVVIGAAFGKIVGSLVGDVVMPLLSPLLGSVNFSDLSVKIAADAAGKPVLLRYGMFLQTCIEFLIIAFAIFVVIKGINRLKRPTPSAPPPAPTQTESLLQDIKDILAKRS